MSFWSKIKNWLGIGGVKIELQVNPSYSKQSETISGKLIVTSKSDQTLQEIKVTVEEHWSYGRGEQKTQKTFELGMVKLPGFSIKAGETQTLEFTAPFGLLKSQNDRMKEQGGVVGGLGKLGAFMDGEKSEYSVIASGDVKGVALGPNDRKAIKLTE